SAVPAGIIASSKGSATVLPRPRRTMRRERCFFVMNMVCSPLRWLARILLNSGAFFTRKYRLSGLHLAQGILLSRRIVQEKCARGRSGASGVRRVMRNEAPLTQFDELIGVAKA